MSATELVVEWAPHEPHELRIEELWFPGENQGTKKKSTGQKHILSAQVYITCSLYLIDLPWF